MNHEVMSAISVFQVKFALEFIRLAMNFSWIALVLKENKHILMYSIETRQLGFGTKIEKIRQPRKDKQINYFVMSKRVHMIVI